MSYDQARAFYPREDTTRTLTDYLIARGSVVNDEQGEPLFVQIRKLEDIEGRITRQRVNSVINHYLAKAGLKRAVFSCHALRHTCGAFLYQATRDIRAVQEMLGQQYFNFSGLRSYYRTGGSPLYQTNSSRVKTEGEIMKLLHDSWGFWTLLTTVLVLLVTNLPCSASSFTGKVVKVSDGDTIQVLILGQDHLCGTA